MKLSVFMLAYNHEPFIEQAIRGVLMQQTCFDFELVIGEDASTDGTAAIVRRLQAEYPDQIRATLRARNVGMHRNFIESYQACTGEYVAFLDGDDYWTAPDKLQKQVDFLDQHPGCSMCFHNVHIQLEEQDQAGGLLFDNPDGRTTFEIEDLILANFVPGCSIVARNRLIDRFPDWLSEVSLVDWVFNLLNARHGSIGYLDESMAVYRKHAGGMWSPHDETSRHERALAVYDRMPSLLDPLLRTLARVAADKLRIWSGKEWLRGQVASHQAEVEKCLQAYNDCLAGSIELKKTRDHLTQQLDVSRAAISRLEDQARVQAAEAARLRARLREMESSRGWRLVLLARRLRGGLGRRGLKPST